VCITVIVFRNCCGLSKWQEMEGSKEEKKCRPDSSRTSVSIGARIREERQALREWYTKAPLLGVREHFKSAEREASCSKSSVCYD
jgi:hypothetical protein